MKEDNEEKKVVEMKGLRTLTALEEALLDALPSDYSEPAEHFINARIELLTAVKSILEKRITRLEKTRERLRKKASMEEAKKEKVPVE